MSRHHHLLLLISAAVFLLLLPAATLSIGVNYGTLGDNLPPPAQVAQFLRSKTTIDRIKIFDANPDILRAFAGTGISVFVTVPNGEIPNLTSLRVARRWVNANIRPFHPRTKISHIAVGNEILHSLDYNLINNLVPAIKSLYRALVLAGIKDIKVSSPHSMGIMLTSEPPSSGKFRPGWDVGVLAPMLQFLRLTKSPFMINPYPYFAYNPQILNYADFRPNKGVYDRYTKITYTNMFEAELDAVHSAMKRLGYGDVDILVAETGWPSVAEPGQPEINAGSAADYNGNLIRHVSSGRGTPLMPNKKFETYIFALFNENLKPGPVAERNWGLFRPDFSPVYRIAGVTREEEA